MDSSPQAQAVLSAILGSSRNVAIFALDRGYRYLLYNEHHARGMKHFWGVEIRVGDDMLALIARADERASMRLNFDRALAGERFTLIEDCSHERMRSYEAAYSPIRDDEDNVVGLTVCLTDISERRRTEIELDGHRLRLEELVEQRTLELELAHAQRLHAQKLESLGALAGGLAHDFNNLLAVILGRAEMCNALLPSDSALRAHLSVIHETALEARMLTKELLAYSGRAKLMPQHTTLNELVEELAPLLRASVDTSIELGFALDADPSAVEIDASQLSQAVLNLVCNAAEAIGDRAGSIQVRTRTLQVDEQLLKRAYLNQGVGRYACLEVEDDGCGMDEVVRGKLFDPFFTTKRSGRGLGLSTVLGIVSAHRGTILLRSTQAGGSCFSLLLPIWPGATGNLVAGAAQAAEQARRRRLVLVVDDEDAVREVTCEVLETLGYDVLQAASGRQACALFGAHPERIDLVLLDMTMPEMNGEQTLRAIRALRAETPVVLMTGYAEEDTQLGLADAQLSGFLAKPFAKRELGEVIERALSPGRAR